ncbi:iron (metal) dependent repressor, DtxR family [Sporobacter termitidis DSM 10068]|uniref:Iron (Metal) dependent repressor, DtxR family n=1 Tax=Sporobacter termitidis DSM 10068 TaxID=1123282 RepID=A0A1M5XHD5_9FIRM|nr:helix-turn-helix domain-containing protein [Sporobacter termitidis]SHH99230.1 iron (metal) dependent repressor, DtxR family [Sporobacter termitidis DSM 10068]
MNLSVSQLRYLFVIKELARDDTVRSLDIAGRIGVSKPSVHGMLGQLERMKLITKEKYSSVLLTRTGLETAQRYYDDFCLIRDYFERTTDMSREAAGEGALAMLGGLDEEKISEICRSISKVADIPLP